MRLTPILFLTSTLALPATSAVSAKPSDKPARDRMERCVERILVRYGRTGGEEGQIGQEVVSRCDRELRDTLAEAIRSGEAPLCSVESCLDIARMRAAEEARDEYRRRFRR